MHFYGKGDAYFQGYFLKNNGFKKVFFVCFKWPNLRKDNDNCKAKMYQKF